MSSTRNRITEGDGYRFAIGVGWAATVWIVIWALVSWGLGAFDLGDHDDSDAPGQHSGLTVRTDHRTGCQYLTGGGGIVPRMDAAGHQVCAR